MPDSPVGNGRAAPLSAADRDFVVRVRLAGLWEMQAGMMAASKGADPRVRAGRAARSPPSTSSSTV